MQLHTRIEERADGFWIVAVANARDTEYVGPFPNREVAKVQEIKTRMDLRLRQVRAAIRPSSHAA